ncbi:hypothetical protein O1L55_37420 [Streptomyces albulus]|nr:hypothetical protein [Streptomyces noursei]
MPARGAVRTQVRVGVADDTGRRTLTIHSRPEAGHGHPWTQHATGVLASGPPTAPTVPSTPRCGRRRAPSPSN